MLERGRRRHAVAWNCRLGAALVVAVVGLGTVLAGCSGDQTRPTPTPSGVTPAEQTPTPTPTPLVKKLPTTDPDRVGSYTLSRYGSTTTGSAYVAGGTPGTTDMMVVVPTKTTVTTAAQMAAVSLDGQTTTVGPAICGTPKEKDFASACFLQYADGVVMVMGMTAEAKQTGAFAQTYYRTAS